MDIPSYNNAEPERHILSQFDVSNKCGVGSHPAPLADLWLIISVWQYHNPSFAEKFSDSIRYLAGMCQTKPLCPRNPPEPRAGTEP
jgi:hypothetical protein